MSRRGDCTLVSDQEGIKANDVLQPWRGRWSESTPSLTFLPFDTSVDPIRVLRGNEGEPALMIDVLQA